MEWFTKCMPIIKGADKYTIVIRHPDDPERAPRPKGGRKDKAPHRSLNKMSEKKIARQVLQLLGDGEPRTLNRIGVELWGKTADVTFGTRVEDVLWQMCKDGYLSFTMRAPIMFKSNSRNKREVEELEATEDPYLPDPRMLRIG